MKPAGTGKERNRHKVPENPDPRLEKIRLKDFLCMSSGFGQPLLMNKMRRSGVGAPDYLTYVNAHPIRWNVPTYILYGRKDNLTSAETIIDFAQKIHADLTMMEDGEHWFHTAEQMKFLDQWIISADR